MGPVLEVAGVVVSFHGFSGEAIQPREGNNLGGLLVALGVGPFGGLEVILGMALRTEHVAQLMRVNLVGIDTDFLERAFCVIT